MTRLRISILFLICLCCTCWSISYAGNLPKNMETVYAEKYAEAIEQFDRSYIQQKEFTVNIKKLQTLGFYNRTYINENSTYYTDFIKVSIAVFCQSAGIPIEESFTPMIRALLADESFKVYPVFPVLRIYEYYRSNDDKVVAYTDRQLRQLRSDTQCAVEGTIISITDRVGASCSIELTSAEGGIYSFNYVYPARSTHFIDGDYIVVYGTIVENSDEIFEMDVDFIGLL